MDFGMLHSHHLFVVLSILLFATKTGLLIAKQQRLLATLNGKTKIPRIVIESLMLLTGIYLVFKAPEGLAIYNVVKYLAIVAAIPLGVIAFKRMKPAFAIAGLLCFFYAYGVSKTRSLALIPEQSRLKDKLAAFQPVSNDPTVAQQRGREIYTIACQRCHGPEGNVNYRKSKKLTESVISDEQKAIIIKNGQKMMPKFEYLSDEEIKDVLLYMKSFR
jgi:mono/diheme cytochrome c family protein